MPAPPTPVAASRSFSFAVNDPAAASPVKSPLTSARNTGTPMAEKWSASTCSETVLPVPVAPVIRPWRLATAGLKRMSAPPPVRAIEKGSAMRRSLSMRRGS